VPRIKGTHTAMKSAMLAAEAAFEAVAADRSGDTLDGYEPALRKSWVAKELKIVRNAQPAVAHWGGTIGTLYAGLDMWLNYLRIGVPWTLVNTGPRRLSKRGRPRRSIIPARWRPDLRPAFVGVHLEHQSRGRSAGSSDARTLTYQQL
jgi:flavin-dependent dehydrogenase